MRAANLHRLARTLREIALLATENIGEDRVNAGEIAVLEDIARNPGSTISDITRRTGLAQSLVSRITHGMADGGALTIRPDSSDRRRVRVDLKPTTRKMILQRASNSIAVALAATTPRLSDSERSALECHLVEADRLLRVGASDESQR